MDQNNNTQIFEKNALEQERIKISDLQSYIAKSLEF